ncbi:MAG: glycosyltransferase family 2 protein [Lachnospiraceae bacterium]|nr:glycosyltransferase family 2 protein [Lachnospiraceae bacterium]MCI8813634.1 glycosyltransferase family 2 protein [Lachnospiraceae bacterium]
MEDLVVILMATYNGEKYLRDQIDSILNQKDVNVELIVRDDGSKDSTIAILQEYANRDSRVLYYSDGNLGPAKSFLDLVKKAPESSFYAFSDQDDVWDPDKISVAVKAIKKLDLNKPAMYFSNLKIVDQNLQFCRMSHSYSQFQKNKYASLAEYMPSGCTMLFNKAAANLINLKEPEWCTMHDVWIYLICMFFGSTTYDIDGHINYRQHSNNIMGAYKKKTIKLYFERIKRALDRNQQPKFNNAVNFYKCYGDMLTDKDKEKVEEIVHYKDSFRNWMKLLFDKDIKATSWSRDIRNRLLILARIF